MEKDKSPPLHSPVTEGVVCDHLVRQIDPSHVVVVLNNTLGFLDDFTTTICKPGSPWCRNHRVVMNGGDHGDSMFVHPLHREQPILGHTLNVAFVHPRLRLDCLW